MVLFCKEGALFENAVFNQLRPYGELAYLSKGSEYEIDFVLTPTNEKPVAVEVKYHAVAADLQKAEKVAQKNNLAGTRLIGRYPAPGFTNFVWGGLIF
jgi:predicted AAA+ superfamily ATPase